MTTLSSENPTALRLGDGGLATSVDPEHDRHLERIESLGLLARGIAHDFNNLIMAIQGNADLARCEIGDATSSVLSFVDEIEHASQRAAEHCRRLMAFAGRGRFALAPVDLNRLVRSCREQLEETAGDAVGLELMLDEQLPSIEANAEELTAALIELVRNAAEAARGPGRVRITSGVSGDDEGRLERGFGADADPGRQYVWIDVSDDGIGMDGATRRRAADPFFSTKDAGRGLGLSTVFGIVRTHAGRMHLVSAPGRGTSVRCYLPTVGAS